MQALSNSQGLRNFVALRNFVRVANFFNPCEIPRKISHDPSCFDFFIFMFFLLSPYVIVFYLYLLVICNGFSGMKHPKQDFVDIMFDSQ